MCRINILGVPVSEQEIQKECLKKYDYEISFCSDGNLFFCNSICDCDSLVGSMSEIRHGISYQEYIRNMFREHLKKMHALREVMFHPSYEKRKKIYQKELRKNNRKLNFLYQPITIFEHNFLEEMEQDHLSDKEKESRFNILQKKLSAMYEEIETSPKFLEWKKENKRLHTGRKELLFQSSMYARERKQKEPYIDDAIAELAEKERNYMENNAKEFNKTKNMLIDFLNKGTSVFYGTIWDEGNISDNIMIKITKNIKISELKIDDLARLAFNEVIKLY